MTVRELLALCEHQIDIGNGDKNIVISNDDEGNGYHSLFYPFLTDPKIVREEIETTCSDRWISESIDDVIILG